MNRSACAECPGPASGGCGGPPNAIQLRASCRRASARDRARLARTAAFPLFEGAVWRLQTAKLSLRETRKTIVQLAQEVGYESGEVIRWLEMFDAYQDKPCTKLDDVSRATDEVIQRLAPVQALSRALSLLGVYPTR